MRRVLIIIAILAAAAACGESQAGSSGTANLGVAQVPAQKSTGTTVPGGTTYAPNQTSTVPVQGPQVIRQAQLTVDVSSGSFDAKLADVRALVELEQGFIAGTDAQATSQTDDRIRTGVITFMVPAAKYDETI